MSELDIFADPVVTGTDRASSPTPESASKIIVNPFDPLSPSSKENSPAKVNANDNSTKDALDLLSQIADWGIKNHAEDVATTTAETSRSAAGSQQQDPESNGVKGDGAPAANPNVMMIRDSVNDIIDLSDELIDRIHREIEAVEIPQDDDDGNGHDRDNNNQ